MPAPRYLRVPPINEAIVDFKLQAPIEVTEAQFAAIRALVGDRYPQHDVRQQLQTVLRFEGGQISADKPQPAGAQGMFLKSADDLTIAQFRGDGFTLNRLRPYTSWDELFPEALALWQHYTQTFGVAGVARMALRYINLIDLPLQRGGDFSEYLTAPPDLPEGVPQGLLGFLMRFNARDQELDTNANITQALDRGPQTTPILLLDIDVYRTSERPVGDLDEVRRTFATLHDLKNRIFFNLVTERCLQLFQ